MAHPPGDVPAAEPSSVEAPSPLDTAEVLPVAHVCLRRATNFGGMACALWLERKSTEAVPFLPPRCRCLKHVSSAGNAGGGESGPVAAEAGAACGQWRVAAAWPGAVPLTAAKP